jgi:hypothetical protein
VARDDDDRDDEPRKVLSPNVVRDIRSEFFHHDTIANGDNGLAQDLAVRPLQRENRFQWWWDVGRVGAGLKVIWEISDKKR